MFTKRVPEVATCCTQSHEGPCTDKLLVFLARGVGGALLMMYMVIGCLEMFSWHSSAAHSRLTPFLDIVDF